MTNYPEIKAEDIRKGYRIRVEYANSPYLTAQEFWADHDRYLEKERYTYFLMSRPVTLPTEPGIYKAADGRVFVLDAETDWSLLRAEWVSKEEVHFHAPLHRLMTATEWEAGK